MARVVLDTTKLLRAFEVPKGEFVRRITVCKPCAGDGATDAGVCIACGGDGYHAMSKTYTRGEFDRRSNRYELNDYSDVGRSVWVKRDTKLLVGFAY